MTDQLGDLVQKLGKTHNSVGHRCGIGAMAPIIAAAKNAKKNANADKDKEQPAKEEEETPLAKALRDR